jgi:hypothetical protein
MKTERAAYVNRTGRRLLPAVMHSVKQDRTACRDEAAFLEAIRATAKRMSDNHHSEDRQQPAIVGWDRTALDRDVAAFIVDRVRAEIRRRQRGY